MFFDNLEKDEINSLYSNIEEYLNTKEIKWIKYAVLGSKTVKIISYNSEFLPLAEKQLSYILKDTADSYDDTLYIWQQDDVFALAKKILDKKSYMRLMLELTCRKAKKFSEEEIKQVYDIQIIDKNYSKNKPVIEFQSQRGFFIANNKENHKYYYGVRDLSPEEFIKEGHIFVQFFNNILKTETSNLIHGAVIGYNNNGICFCARGQRGKSTLSVLSMIKGFEYVSDDYLILHQNDKRELLSSPIYSIITLSPEMYNRLYDLMGESKFVSNNARKDKYVFNISNFHDRFKSNYPIKLCIFPEIVKDKNPSIKLCTKEEKGRAIVQMVQSTLIQTGDIAENNSVKKLMNMIINLPFYKLNLCYDINYNTEFLREFMNKFDTIEKPITETPKIALDITFDLANILDTKNGIIYSMNKFTTNIFENLLNGISKQNIQSELNKLSHFNKNLIEEFEVLLLKLEEKGIFTFKQTIQKEAQINLNFAKEDNYKLDFTEYINGEIKQLIK